MLGLRGQLRTDCEAPREKLKAQPPGDSGTDVDRDELYSFPMRFILWMLILFWCAIFVLNLRALHTIQEWILSVKSSYILMLLPGALLLCILTARAVDDYRRRHSIVYGLLAFAAAAYGAYATLLSGDPIDPLRYYIRPAEQQVLAVILGLLFILFGIVSQMRAAPESGPETPSHVSPKATRTRAAAHD